MSSFLTGTGGGRAYRLNLDLIKPPTTFSTSNSSSPSSTLSESSNSPLSIFSRKPRTPRKRPNQTYNEAATILSTAYPKLFPPKNLSKPYKFTKSHDGRTPFLSEPPELLMIGGSGCLLQCPPMMESSAFPAKAEKPCLSPGEVSSQQSVSEICDEHQDDFDAESILDEEIEEGIDSIMGNLRVDGEASHQDSNGHVQRESFCYGFPVGMGFDFGYGMRRELRAMKNVDEGDWWSFPSVNVADITHKIARMPVEKKKKNSESGKKTSFPAPPKQKKESLSASASASSEESVPPPTAGLRLKLNYDDVLNAWSEKGSPFSGEPPCGGGDVQGRLAQIDLFPERHKGGGGGGNGRKEKRRTPVLSKKITFKTRIKGREDVRR